MFTSKSQCICALLIFCVVYMVHSRQHIRFYRRRVGPSCSVRKGFIMANLGECSFRLPSRGCYGECLSSVQPLDEKPGLASSCSCCAPIKMVWRKKTLRCKNKVEDVRYPVAIRCACRPCSWAKNIELIIYEESITNLFKDT